VNLKIGDALAKEMKAVGIAVVGDDSSDLKFKCKSCGEGWSVKWDGNEEAVRGWWRCPGGCNADIVRASKIDFRQLWGEVERSRK
jgi:hypothetical protein